MRKILLCLMVAGALGAAAPAFASDNNREDRGGIDVGPLGQCFDPVPPTDCRGYERGAYAYGYAYGFAPSARFRYGRHER
jgi:hypothetical protein